MSDIKIGDTFTVNGTYLLNEPTAHPHGVMPLSEKERTLAMCPICGRCIYAVADTRLALPIEEEYRASWQKFHNSGHGHYPACPGIYQWKEAKELPMLNPKLSPCENPPKSVE